MATEYTPNENLYKWKTTDSKQTTIQEMSSNAVKIDAKLNDHTVQLADIVANVKSYGAKGDNVANDTTAIQSAIDYVKSNGGGTVYIPKGTYKVDGLSFLNVTGVNFEGASNGVVINIAGSTALVSGETLGILFDNTTYVNMKNIKFQFLNEMTAIRFGRLAGGYAYYNSFEDCLFQGSNAANTNQKGLVIENAFTNSFLNCNFRLFGNNVNIKTVANRNIFEGCTFVPVNLAGAINIDIESGMANAFIGCDIEKGERWIRNTGGHVIFSDGCYFETAVGAGSAELRGGLTDIHDCYLGDPQIYVYSGGDFIFKNNYVLKNGSSYAIYFREINIPFFDCVGNYVTPQTSNSVGLLFRGYESGVQYTSDLSAWANGTITKYFNVNQERVFNVNVSQPQKIVNNMGDNQYQKGAMTVGGALTTNGLMTANALKQNQSTWQNPLKIGIYNIWFNGKNVMIADFVPTYNTNGTVWLTLP